MMAILAEMPEGMECDLVSRLAPVASARLLNDLPDPVLGSWLETGSLDSGYRLLARISKERAARVIAVVSNRSKRQALKRFAGYPADSIGALVQTQFVTIKENTPAADIGKMIQLQPGAPESPIFVERSDGKLKGVLDLTRLVRNQDAAAIADDFCIPVRPVYPDSLSSSLENPAEWTGFTSLPVVDHEGRPIGHITRAALENARSPGGDNDPLLGSVAELSKRFWEVSAALLVFIFGGRAER
jgi:Mg/Co/Ni transporter MgtE